MLRLIVAIGLSCGTTRCLASSPDTPSTTLTSILYELAEAVATEKYAQNRYADISVTALTLSNALYSYNDSLQDQQKELASTIAKLHYFASRGVEILQISPWEKTYTLQRAIAFRALLPKISKQLLNIQQEMAETITLQDNLSQQKQLATQENIQAHTQYQQLRQRLQNCYSKAQDLNSTIYDSTPSSDNLDLPSLKKQSEFSPPNLRLTLPTRGKVITTQKFSKEGVLLKSITLSTTENSRISAPAAGQVAFSGNFLKYGPLLILDHGQGYHTVLAGMASLAVQAGQNIQSGELVGYMGTYDDVQKLKLKIELRRNGAVIDPQPFLNIDSDLGSNHRF